MWNDRFHISGVWRHSTSELHALSFDSPWTSAQTIKWIIEKLVSLHVPKYNSSK